MMMSGKVVATTIAVALMVLLFALDLTVVPTMFALSAVLGPTAGGFLTDTVGWRWIFFLNVPVAAAALAIFLTTYTPAVRAQPSGSPITLADLDFAGFGAFATGVISLLLA